MTIQTVTGETLAEFNQSKMADPFAATEKEAEKAEEKAKVIKAAEEKEEQAEEPEEKDAEVKEEKPKKGKLAERFSEITAARNAERTAREAAEARAAELAAKLAEYEKPKPKEEKKAPDPKDYVNFDEYTDAVAEYKAEQKLAERAQAEQKAKEEAKAGEVVKAWNTRLESAKEKYEDFHDIVSSSPLQYEPVVRKVIMESEFGPDILYHLSNDDKDADKFAKLDIDQRVKFIGRLEGKFEALKDEPAEEEEERPAKVEKPKVKLPSPITPIKAKSTSVDPINAPGEFTGTYAQYKAARQKSLQ